MSDITKLKFSFSGGYHESITDLTDFPEGQFTIVRVSEMLDVRDGNYKTFCFYHQNNIASYVGDFITPAPTQVNPWDESVKVFILEDSPLIKKPLPDDGNLPVYIEWDGTVSDKRINEVYWDKVVTETGVVSTQIREYTGDSDIKTTLFVFYALYDTIVFDEVRTAIPTTVYLNPSFAFMIFDDMLIEEVTMDESSWYTTSITDLVSRAGISSVMIASIMGVVVTVIAVVQYIRTIRVNSDDILVEDTRVVSSIRKLKLIIAAWLGLLSIVSYIVSENTDNREVRIISRDITIIGVTGVIYFILSAFINKWYTLGLITIASVLYFGIILGGYAAFLVVAVVPIALIMSVFDWLVIDQIKNN